MYLKKNKTSDVTVVFLAPQVAPISHAIVGCRRDNRKVRWCVKGVAVPNGRALVVRCVLYGKR